MPTPVYPPNATSPGMLRTLPNPVLQGLLDRTVARLQAELSELGIRLGENISLDTKPIIAWVEENNPKAYVEDRYNKDRQPKGDPDCRLGCKRRHNQRASSKAPPPTPSKNPQPADTVSVGEYYWGYASGVVALHRVRRKLGAWRPAANTNPAPA